jgi:hypothetical protein
VRPTTSTNVAANGGLDLGSASRTRNDVARATHAGAEHPHGCLHIIGVTNQQYRDGAQQGHQGGTGDLSEYGLDIAFGQSATAEDSRRQPEGEPMGESQSDRRPPDQADERTTVNAARPMFAVARFCTGRQGGERRQEHDA